MGPPQMAPAGHVGAVNTTSAWLEDLGGLSTARRIPVRAPSRAAKPSRVLYRLMSWTDLGRSGACWFIWPPHISGPRPAWSLVCLMLRPDVGDDQPGQARVPPGNRPRARCSEPDGFAEQQDGAPPWVGFGVEDEQPVDRAGLPVGRLGTSAFQRKAVVPHLAQRGLQVGHHLLRPDDPDRAGGAARVAG